jgi:hypothetical protein
VSDDYVKFITRFLARHQISDYRFEKRARHRAVVVAHLGAKVTVIFPATGSDRRRGPRKAVSDLRHALGLVGEAPQ